MALKNKVSIILTVYNINPRYLDKCLRSINEQSYGNYEIILIDDCSVIKYDYTTIFFKNVKYYRNKTNLGLLASVKKGFSLATGEYIVRLGSDDYFHRDLLLLETRFLDNHEDYGAVCCNIERFRIKINKYLVIQRIIRPKEWNLKSILDGDIEFKGYAGGMMFRKSLLTEKGINISDEYPVCEDFDFHLKILEVSQIGSIPMTLYYYRSHKTNIMKQFKGNLRKEIINKIMLAHGGKEYYKLGEPSDNKQE